MKQLEFMEINAIKRNSFHGFLGEIPMVKDKHELLSNLAEHLLFPIYFGFNWDALEEVLHDFSWISETNIMIVHKDLSNLPDLDFKVYNEIVNDTISFWRRRGQHNVSFIFQTYEKYRWAF